MLLSAIRTHLGMDVAFIAEFVDGRRVFRYVDTAVEGALASALIRHAREAQAEIIAEGVETKAELDTLLALGITKAQGYYFGKATSLGEAVELSASPAVSPR